MDSTKFSVPGDNAVTISQDLVSEIRRRFRSDRDNKFKLYLLSSGMRAKYLDSKTNLYVDEFREWFEGSGVSELFGSLSNFTKYAAAGDVIDYVANQTAKPSTYLAQLPVSLRALYEIYQIIKLDEEAFRVCFHFTPTRPRVGAPKHEWITKNTSSLIHPHASSVKLAAWRQRWENPESNKKDQDKYRRNVKLLTVSVSEDIFSFDASGKQGVVDLEEVQSLLAQIQALFSKNNEKQFRLETQIERIEERYTAARDKADPAKALKSPKKDRADDYK